MTRSMSRSARWSVLGALLLGLSLAGLNTMAAPGEQPFVNVPNEKQLAEKQQQRQAEQPLNNAPVWREVRSGVGITQIKGVETGVLVQSGGETWRELRNGPITFYGSILLLAVPVLFLVFHVVKGPMKLHHPETGRKIQRFSAWDRVIHWSTAISWVLLAITGIMILFGKHFLLPVFGYTVFAFLTNIAKNIHNFVGPYFIVSALAMFFTYLSRNIPRAHDLTWLSKLGGIFSGKEVPSGFFNAGEKIVFWVGLFLFTIIVGASGLILLFPNFDQGREVMQIANIVHSIASILFMAMIMGHIYLGTVGVPGAYKAMRTDGKVDEQWAKEHHELWYNEVKGKAQPAAGSAPGAAPQRA
ncbi:MAG: formate dehydrogenase subunit gamma [Pseudomonadota bacterium]